MGPYHLARKSGNFGLKSNGKVIFQKFRSEIVEYLQRYSSFSVRNGTAEISLPFAKLSSFQSLISRKQSREIEVQMVSANFVRSICWFWKNPYHYSTLVPTGLFWQMVSTQMSRVPVRLSRRSLAFYYGKVPSFTYSASLREYKPAVYFLF